MDIKQAIANGIQEQLLKEVPLDGSEPIEELEHEVPGYGITASAVDQLNTQIRVRGSKGIRYFTVKVTEHW